MTHSSSNRLLHNQGTRSPDSIMLSQEIIYHYGRMNNLMKTKPGLRCRDGRGGFLGLNSVLRLSSIETLLGC